MHNKTLLPTLAICTILFQAIPELTYAQISEFKIIAFDGATFDHFGESVSIFGDYAVVGAIFDDDNGESSGSAYVFKRSGTRWIVEAKLLASDGTAGNYFGNAVSISGDYAVVGAVADDDNGNISGSAYVFKRSGTSWMEEAKLIVSDGEPGDEFGRSVSISGDYAVIGSILDDDNGDASGSAYVFKRTDTSWIVEAKLLASDGAASDFFGSAVSISGDYAVVGAWADDDNGPISGSAYVFKRSGTSWTQEAKLLASDGAASDRFGNSVSISGNYAVVGASDDDDNGTGSGSAYVFKRSGTSWTQEAKLLASDGAAGDLFGGSVSISGNYAVIGSIRDDDNGNSSGSAYLFKRNDTSWTQETKLLPSDGAANEVFGWSVSISGDYAIIGTIFDDDNGTEAGSIYIYNGFTPSVGIERQKQGLPSEFLLSQNYPNPFNPVTTIEYTLPQSGVVSFIIYDIKGQEVTVILNEYQFEGIHSVTWDASNVASGIYFYRLQAGDFVQTRKMVLLK